MKTRWLLIATTTLTAVAGLFVLLGATGGVLPGLSTPARAAPLAVITPTVTGVAPATAPNDLDTTVVVTGSGLAAGMSGSLVLTPPVAYLGQAALEYVTWANSTTLTATVPWGLEPGVYTLTVANPEGGTGSLARAFTVTQGIDVWTTNGPYGGSVHEIKVNPHDPSRLYAIAHQMGLLISEDGAAHWQPALFNLNPPGQITVDAGDPDRLYAGTDNSFMVSGDGGVTWEQRAALSAPFQSWRHTMVAHPSLPGVVYAATGNLATGRVGGVHRSDDYGASWITLTAGLTDTGFTSLAIHPTLTGTLLAGTESGNLYASLDGGETWTLTGRIDYRVLDVFFNPYVPLEAWATGADAYTPFRSSDLATWAPVPADPGSLSGRTLFWDMAFLTDTLWVAANGLYTSTDGGANWTPVADAPGALSIDVHPARPSVLYAGDFTHGVFKSSDGGRTWQQSSDGLAGLNPSTVLVAPGDPETVYTKVDLGLVKSEDGGQTWRSLDFGQGGFPDRTKLAIDPFQPQRLYFGLGCPDAVCLWISDDGGEDPDGWLLVTATLPLTYSGWNGAFYTVVPHPAVPGRILAGVQIWPPGLSFWDDQTQGLFFGSDDYGLTWSHLGPTRPISWINDLAFDSQDPTLIYAATQGTGLWKSTDAGSSWTTRTLPAGLDFIETVATHPQAAGTVYAIAADGTGGPDNGLYVSEDAGDTWTRLPGAGGVQLLFAPTQPPTLYTGCGLGDEFNAGVCRSRDGGQTWEALNGIAWPTAMAAGTDGERVMVHIGSAGGMAPPVTATHAARRGTAGLRTSTYSALGSGVYRYTSRLPSHWIYLPLSLRTYPGNR